MSALIFWFRQHGATPPLSMPGMQCSLCRQQSSADQIALTTCCHRCGRQRLTTTQWLAAGSERVGHTLRQTKPKATLFAALGLITALGLIAAPGLLQGESDNCMYYFRSSLSMASCLARLAAMAADAALAPARFPSAFS